MACLMEVERREMSVVPPGAKPTMMRTGRVGYVCARAIRDHRCGAEALTSSQNHSRPCGRRDQVRADEQPTPVGESHATTGAPIATDWACAVHGAMAKSRRLANSN